DRLQPLGLDQPLLRGLEGLERVALVLVQALVLAKGPDRALLGERPVDRADELPEIDRLDEVGGGLAVDRLDRAVQRGVPGDQDDRGLRRDRLDVLEEVDARDVGQLEVDDREVHRLEHEMLEGLLPAMRGPHPVPSMLQHVADRGAQPRVVVDHENLSPFVHGYLPGANCVPPRDLARDVPAGPGARAPPIRAPEARHRGPARARAMAGARGPWDARYGGASIGGRAALSARPRSAWARAGLRGSR